jgi:hypothetical protein
MATPSTVDVVHPEIGLAAEAHSASAGVGICSEGGRRDRAAPLHSGWREEATVRAITRMGA